MNDDRPRVRLYVVGGFLGAGKTTALTALAGYFMKQGLRVAIITNDQTGGLVDSDIVRTHGIHYREIAGACFCSRFRDFLEAADTLLQAARPQIILAEPVGSAADLIATVIKPLRAYTGERYTVMPLTVLADPERIAELFGDRSNWPDDIRYLYERQLQEADFILLSKADRIPAPEMENAKQWLRKQYEILRPSLRIQPFSAITGEGIEDWLHGLDEIGSNESVALPTFDRERHARAEAALAWLNLDASLISANSDIEVDAVAFVQGFFQRLKDRMNGGHVGHLKVFVQSPYQAIKASVSDWRLGYSLDALPSGEESILPGNDKTRIRVNARVVSDPQVILGQVRFALREAASLQQVEVWIHTEDALRPGKPAPMYRIGGSEKILGSE